MMTLQVHLTTPCLIHHLVEAAVVLRFRLGEDWVAVVAVVAEGAMTLPTRRPTLADGQIVDARFQVRIFRTGAWATTLGSICGNLCILFLWVPTSLLINIRGTRRHSGNGIRSCGITSKTIRSNSPLGRKTGPCAGSRIPA